MKINPIENSIGSELFNKYNNLKFLLLYDIINDNENGVFSEEHTKTAIISELWNTCKKKYGVIISEDNQLSEDEFMDFIENSKAKTDEDKRAPFWDYDEKSKKYTLPLKALSEIFPVMTTDLNGEYPF